MEDELDITFVTSDQLVAEELQAAISEMDGIDAETVQRRGIDASAAQWVVLAGVGAQALQHLFDFLVQYKKLNRVAKIKSGNLEIENPTPELIERVLQERANRA